MTSPQTLIDLSHTVAHGLVTYKRLPAPIICDYLSREASRKLYAPGTEFQIGKIEMVANTGTYLDSPFHRYADGKDLSQLELEKLANLPPNPAFQLRADGLRSTRVATDNACRPSFWGWRIRESRAPAGLSVFPSLLCSGPPSR